MRDAREVAEGCWWGCERQSTSRTFGEEDGGSVGGVGLVGGPGAAPLQRAADGGGGRERVPACEGNGGREVREGRSSEGEERRGEVRGGGGGWRVAGSGRREAGERRTVYRRVNTRARRRQVRVVRHATHRAPVLTTGLAPGQAPRRRRRRPPLLAAQGRRPRRLREVRTAALAARLALEGRGDGGGEVERRRALVAGTRRARFGRLR